MKLKQYLNESTTVRFSKPKEHKSKEISVDVYKRQGPHGTYKTSGKTKAVWRIWDEHVGHYHPDQHTTLEKAKEGLANYLMRRGKVRIPL